MIESCQHRPFPDIAHSHGRRFAKTWRSPIQKATDEPPDDFKWLQDIADSLLPDVREAFLRAIDRIRNTLDESRLRAALESGNVDEVMAALDLGDPVEQALRSQISAPLEDAFIQAGRAAPERTALRAGQVAYRFDLSNPHAVDFLRTYDMGLIRQVSDETRQAVRSVVEQAFVQGGHPREQARQIRQLVGLTDRQSRAAMNYRAALIEEERPADQIERMATKYADRLLRLRAENIGRTETMRASNAGQQAAWQQAADDQLINRVTARRHWLVTPDDRLCVFCAAIPGLNPEGVPLDGSFITEFGLVDYPPLHPQCRCITVLRSF